ncbi:hypothetical protein FSP39_001661 [Pinctada imbricata]|uniref:protein-serine/threonine phosphatase n=1 Tax=Pinctada imbricata TaxID=66713 RepID=A0AA88YK84_PINIB|nr:hypothetical protein FSP39_001661 [Pinctada imbricata]
MDPEEDGGLLGALQNFNKSKLRQTTTKVTTTDGRLFVEKRGGDGDFVQNKVDCDPKYGFVVDPNADLQVGEIVPGLILGSQDIAVDESILKKYHVTHILNMATLIKNMFPDRFVYKTIDLLDVPDTNILPHFDEAFKFIEEGRQARCTLVHCNAGISRSSTVVIAYLMRTYGVTLQVAYDHVKSKRSRIRPNAGFQSQLKAYEKELLEKGLIDTTKTLDDNVLG